MGSEMCIRDSVRRTRTRAPAHAREQACQNGGARSTAPRARRARRARRGARCTARAPCRPHRACSRRRPCTATRRIVCGAPPWPAPWPSRTPACASSARWRAAAEPCDRGSELAESTPPTPACARAVLKRRAARAARARDTVCASVRPNGPRPPRGWLAGAAAGRMHTVVRARSAPAAQRRATASRAARARTSRSMTALRSRFAISAATLYCVFLRASCLRASLTRTARCRTRILSCCSRTRAICERSRMPRAYAWIRTACRSAPRAVSSSWYSCHASCEARGRPGARAVSRLGARSSACARARNPERAPGGHAAAAATWRRARKA